MSLTKRLPTLWSLIRPSLTGGEHGSSGARCRCAAGSSPRRRGTQPRYMPSCVASRFIPAQAGNTRRSATDRSILAVHPRAGGEHSQGTCRAAWHLGSSPRRRGTLGVRQRTDLSWRFIPAQAGNTRQPRPR
ncbi:Hypothetical protein GbCGDNIH4_7229 [Granulibacter bethesdensis CGDNIH4]|nr:Hypothetical protein GbCGDNIH4_7229 [Granulibacter bethesdensis CGDNIH4]